MASVKNKSLVSYISEFRKMNVMIIGDVMIDAYLWGKVDRISPEAPVPIVSVTKRENRPGGAANVAINIHSLGATPVLCSVIGDDLNGRTFTEIIQELGMSTEGLVQSPDRPTTRKTRVIGNNHQMLRVDEEREEDLSPSERKRLLERIESILSRKKTDVIVIEDYDKGVISKSLIEQVVGMARQYKIPVAVDPKRRNFNHYKNVDLFKPNLKELKEGIKMDPDENGIQDIIAVAKKFRKEKQIGTLLLTLSEKGVLVLNDSVEKIIPAHVRNIADVSGAGDTVIGVAALCLAIGLNAEKTATIANLAGGLVCEKVGVVPVEPEQLIEEIKRLGIS
ncbi:MAG: D-glycero-beta-D-manno-heptose-7-phosphate kinase [Bacteroidetes bacterium]|nr:MAG: D-glycero-beta-D-manno-heptose-7-phosphate kinase [Bacteroidota bacterium]REK08157.1 MAG: D-glycero-beta-D-manno-heptose-7-phosphate kinase [Bacteroidota bacterium]REK32362.1 MAG: D-glycero-beta-D-manno-heptose-7-phosphate kinase [Bacteroidota bacterium]REK49596.1 MAG: D-glycero-beta-D-manno-heptose-7-phosphate kinase [Bacteroidota bacterium]